MKILFICGSLEPGRDGVGDYTRRLAGELIRHGHQTTIVAINDKYLTETFNGFQKDGKVSIPVLRIKAGLSEKKRFAQTKRWIEEIKPEWISLQFVPFAFHSKGLPFRLSTQLNNLGEGCLWHIMFHELWVGMEVNTSRKLLCWGWIQKHIIKLLISKLHPHIIHTQTLLYQIQLSKIGFNAKYLPLFGNIPIVKSSDMVNKKQDCISQKKNALNLVLFGAIHSGVPVEHLADEAAQYAKQNKIKVSLTMVGRNGSEQAHWASVWRAAGLDVELLGEQPPEQISETLKNASLGISTTPLALLEKSGSVAAMREHGLPVLCVRQAWKAKNIPSLTPPSGIFEYRIGKLEACLHKLYKTEANSLLKNVGGKLVDDLLFAQEKSDVSC